MQKIRNIAIIAHVDHGKTTLVDKMLLAGKLFREGQAEPDQFMDNNDLERERGITILAKNVSINYKGYKINIIDTPGHADFGGEVERVLNMADGCLLLVDAFEGPMPQTRFVLQKAIQLGLKPIVVINKVDKPNCRPSEVQEMVFDLMFSLDATEEQLDFPTIYGSAKQGWMSEDWKEPKEDIAAVLDAIIKYIPEPKMLEGTPQMLITSLDYSKYVGRIAVGRVHRGELREGQDVMLCKRDGSMVKSRIKEVDVFEGLGRTKVDSVQSGDICAIIGIHALFGAFMAGVVMPPSIGFRKVMMEKVEDIALVFFLPLFFAFTGLRTEIGLINSPALWGVCLLLITVAVAGKLGGCAVAARLVGESWKDSFTIGTLMNTRGLMELVALNIGYEMGVLPPSIFVILVIMALVTTFMTTPLLHLVERIFARREERLSAKLKLVFCFGRPESGRSLLSIFFLLFGKKMKAAQVVAAHFTVGTDLNPLNAEQYARDSFSLVDEKASELGLSVENRYRVTDKLVQDMIRLARKERPDMFLLGAGSKYRPDTAGSNGVLWLSLFRDKIDDVMEQVKCPVAVFVNRGYSGSSPVSFVLGGGIDAFLLTYLESMLEGGAQVHLFLFDTDDEAFRQSTDPILAKYSSQIRTQPFSGAANLTSAAKDGLLVMSHLSYTKLSEEEEVFRDLPSLLVIRRPKKG